MTSEEANQATQRHWARARANVFKRQHGQTWVHKPRRATESSQEPNPSFPGETLQDGDPVWVFNLLGDTDDQAGLGAAALVAQ